MKSAVTSAVRPDLVGGIAAYSRGSYADAYRVLEPIAQKGDAEAQFYVAVMFHFGQHVTQSEQNAAAWYRRAAEQGIAGAMRNLGVLYEEGRGKRQSYDKAAKWYRRAAENGDILAQHNLAMMYTEGKGVPEDDTEAARWLRRAADGGDSLSQIALALHYNVGLGVPQDPVQAYFWLGVAAKAVPPQGPEQERVTFLRRTVARQMSPSQINEAENRARAWKPTGVAE